MTDRPAGGARFPGYDLRWSIGLRWLVVVLLPAGVFIAESVFRVTLEAAAVLGVVAFVGFYNLAFHLAVVFEGRWRKPLRVRVIAIASIVLDLFCLTAILRFTGGAENLLLFYFVFHVLISGILLPPGFSLLQTILACVLFLSLVWSEYAGLIRHYPVGGFLVTPLYDNPAYLSFLSAVFLSLMFISLYIVTRVTRQIVDRDRHLEEANRQLKEKDRMKSEYVLRVSHDIKGHLAAVQSCIHPVQAGFLGPLSDGQKNLLDRAEKRTSRLLLFVKALLNLTIARLKEGSAEERLDLAAAIRDAVDLVEPAAQTAGITLRREIPAGAVGIPGSRAEVQAVFQELLSNAVKYARPGGMIGIGVRMAANRVEVSVRDDGIGIPVAELPYVFDEFFRSSNAGEDEGGTGMGLAMAKHVVEKLGGRISVESEEGQGSLFRIVLPLSGD